MVKLISLYILSLTVTDPLDDIEDLLCVAPSKCLPQPAFLIVGAMDHLHQHMELILRVDSQASSQAY